MLLRQCLLAVPIFHITLFVTFFIQAAILMPINCEVPNSESRLNHCSCPMKISTLSRSATNLTAAHNSYRRNTQQAVHKTTHKDSVPATDCPYLKFCTCYILLG
jgi:hypothetical protein